MPIRDSYKCSAPSTKAVKSSLKESLHGPVSEGKVTWDNEGDRGFMRCDLKEYKLFAGPTRNGTLIIAQRINKFHWLEGAIKGRQDFWVYILVLANDFV